MQAAKGPGQGGFDRLEHEVRLPPDAAQAPPLLARHHGHPVHALLAAALLDGAADLQPIFETDIRRVARTLHAKGTAVEIALDRGEVRAGLHSQRVQELEIELKQGPVAGAIGLARSWCRSHALWLDPQTKSALGRRLFHGEEKVPASKAQPLAGADRHLLPAIFDAALRQALANAREVAAGTGEDEHVHQLRVGIRRLRTALRELQGSGAWQPLDAAIEEALRGLFGQLGEHRDRSTLLPTLLQDLLAAGSPVAPWQPPLPDIGAAVRDAPVQDAFLGLVALAQELREHAGVAPKALRAVAGDRLDTLHRKLRKKGRRFEQLPQPQRHAVRKRLKRLRYLAELVRPLYEPAAVDAYVDALKQLQDALGRYQDAVAGRALFEQRSREDPSAWFGVGWLAAREEQLAQDCARACRQAARKAKPFWN